MIVGAVLLEPTGRARSRPPSSFVHASMSRSAHPPLAQLLDALAVSPEPLGPDATPCRVIVVDADRRVRRDLAGLVDLGDGFACVGVAGDPGAALDLIRRLDPDVIVLDPRLPDVDAGLALVSQLRRESEARIVVLGNDPELGARARTLGADEFVVKDAQLSPLVEAIHRPEGRNGSHGPDGSVGGNGSHGPDRLPTGNRPRSGNGTRSVDGSHAAATSHRRIRGMDRNVSDGEHSTSQREVRDDA